MDLRDYAMAIVTKVEAAGERGDKAEAARLLRLLSEVAIEQARKLEVSAETK